MIFFLKSILTLLILLFSIKYIFNCLKNIIKKINIGRNENLNTSMGSRIIFTIRMVLFQEKLLDDKLYGFLHFWYLYGFLILGIGHIELLLNGLFSFVHVFGYKSFLYSNFDIIPDLIINTYTFSQDFFASVVIIVASYALYRRVFGKTIRLLPRSRDAELILWFINILYVTFFIHSLFHYSMILTEKINFNYALPVTSTIASILSIKNYSILLYGEFLGYFAHYIMFIGFACYIFNSKHMHLIFAGPNIFYSSKEAHEYKVRIPNRIDFETSEQFGVQSVKELTWKTILDTFACTECSRCNSVCPANITDKPLKPKKIINDIKYNLHNYVNSIKDSEEISLIDKSNNSNGITLDEIWSCTTCGACSDICPVIIDSVPNTIIDIRRHLILMEADNYPKELNNIFKGMENQGNPWGVGENSKFDWVKKLNIPIINKENKDNFDYLLYIGCAGSIDDKAIESQIKFVKILQSLKISFGILGNKEKCCGDPARRSGNEYLFENLATENIKSLKEYKSKKILTSCPHCYNQLKNEYKEYDVSYNIEHHTEFLLRMIHEKKIKFSNANSKVITFHDPCYLGRYNNKYSDVRKIFSILKANFKEMRFNKRNSFCCGAGGGKMFMEETIGTRINRERIRQAKEIKADVIITACPFCKNMLNDGLEGITTIDIKDISELIYNYKK